MHIVSYCEACGRPTRSTRARCQYHRQAVRCGFPGCSRWCHGELCHYHRIAARRAAADLAADTGIEEEDEWTEERVEALVAEQMKNLPKWWGRATKLESDRQPRSPGCRQPVRLMLPNGRRLQ